MSFSNNTVQYIYAMSMFFTPNLYKLSWLAYQTKQKFQIIQLTIMIPFSGSCLQSQEIEMKNESI